MGRNPNFMGYPFPQDTRAVSSLYPYPLHFLLSIPQACHNIIYFQIQPTVAKHKELVWLNGNLKLEVTKYSKQIYRPSGYAQPNDDDDLEAT